jgi:hypothetical protein
MEEDIQRYRIKTSDRVEKRLQEAIKKAAEALGRETAHDKELLRALSVVREFIQRKKRICYGGTAMNEILPKSKRFYDPDTDLPDYDFYTPDVDQDVEDLIQDLQKAGFKDIYHKVGIHEGTKKILVNFVAVADITAIDEELYAVIFRRSVVKDSIHYTDPEILRMMMYLELSRPHGDVSRWEKVFERLQLINQEFPMRGKCKGEQRYTQLIPKEVHKIVLDYGIEKERILCNGPLAAIYSKGIRHKTFFDTKVSGPLFFTSPDPKADISELKSRLPGYDLSKYLHEARGDIVPMRVELRMGDVPVCMFIEETACHSYNTVLLPDRRRIDIASLEFLITLYLSILIFTNHSTDFLGEQILCQVKHFIELSRENYRAKRSQFPPFSLKCKGHQVSYVSLLKAKIGRVKEEKEKEKKRTRKMKRKQRAKTKKAESK